MRWERLFADLEGTLDAEAERALDAEVADRTRRERALVGLHERLAAQARDVPITARVAGLGQLRGTVADVGADWVLLAQAHDRHVLVPLDAVRSVGGLVGRVEVTTAVGRGFGLRAALRAISRDRSAVTVCCVDDVRLTGTIDAVGRDCLDVAEHPLDLPRRSEYVRGVCVVPFAALAAVRPE